MNYCGWRIQSIRKEALTRIVGKGAGLPDRAEKQQINKVRTMSFPKK
jgi:hypothetical protein